MSSRISAVNCGPLITFACLTFSVTLLRASGPAEAANIWPRFIPKLCDVLFNSQTDCPSPSFIKKDLICFVANTSFPISFAPKLERINRRTDRKICECQKWSGVIFTKLQGHRCIQKKSDQYQSSPQVEFTTDTLGEGGTGIARYSINITLYRACEEGKLDVVKYILSEGLADINERGEYGRTPIMAAARDGLVDIFDFLVSRGCDLSIVDQNSQTVLHLACASGNTDIVRRLTVDHNFDKDCRGDKGSTPVIAAVYCGEIDVFNFLVTKGCNLRAVDDDGNNILHAACGGGHVDVVKLILSYRVVSIESRGQYERTPILIAARAGYRDIFELIKAENCNLSAVYKYGSNVIHEACIGGQVAMVRYILSHHISAIESRGFAGRTPVMAAAENGHRAVIDLLVRKGANPKMVDVYGRNILHWACSGGKLETVEYILTHGWADKDSRTKSGTTPVLDAARRGHIGVVKILVRNGCDIRVVNNYKNNILHEACAGGNTPVVKYILSLNIFDIDCRGYAGRTPVIIATKLGHKGVVELLVSKHCNLRAVDVEGNTVLHIAFQRGQVGMLKVLKALGVTEQIKTVTNKYGLTPVQMEKSHG